MMGLRDGFWSLFIRCYQWPHWRDGVCPIPLPYREAVAKEKGSVYVYDDPSGCLVALPVFPCFFQWQRLHLSEKWVCPEPNLCTSLRHVGTFREKTFGLQSIAPTWTGVSMCFCSLLRFLGHSAPIAHPGLRRWRMGWSVAMSPSVPWLGILFSIQPGMMIIGDPHWPTYLDVFGPGGLKQVETGWNRLKPPTSCGDCFAAGFWWNFVDLCCVHKHPQALPRHSLLGPPKAGDSLGVTKRFNLSGQLPAARVAPYA